MRYVYILKLSNGDYYAGKTDDLERRLREHSSGSTSSTSKYLPYRLITYLAFANATKADDFEKYLKTSSGFAFRNKRLI